ncbi:Inner membrane protein YccS [Arsenophonus endosymbiont of Bemisia tabaci Q2]|nr:Inner membrane protein YccS [Arsenophonus endosymbiont of Bemisia tabaci Q2]
MRNRYFIRTQYGVIKIKSLSYNLTLNSTLFRHPIRMSEVLCTGYIIVQCFNLPQGYWIFLTSLFVCQPNYIATKNYLILRIIGTIAAILIGLPLLYFVPSIEGQLLLIIISDVFSLPSAMVNMPKPPYLLLYWFY